jgi:hypothetical protein
MTGGIREGVNMEKDGDSQEDNDEGLHPPY